MVVAMDYEKVKMEILYKSDGPSKPTTRTSIKYSEQRCAQAGITMHLLVDQNGPPALTIHGSWCNPGAGSGATIWYQHGIYDYYNDEITNLLMWMVLRTVWLNMLARPTPAWWRITTMNAKNSQRTL